MAGRDLEDFFQSAQSNQQAEDTYQKMGISAPPAPPKTRVEMARLARKKRHHRMMRNSIIVVIFLIFVAAAVFVFTHVHFAAPAKDSHDVVQDYPGPGTGSVEFTVDTGDSSAVIGEHLESKGIVKSADLFNQAVLSADAESSLQPGVFTLRYRMSSSEVVKILTNPALSKGMLQVTSDDRVSDIITEAASLSGTPKSDFQAVIDSKGEGILPPEANGSFEGWLEPGTYNAKKIKSAKAILTDMVTARIKKLDDLKVPTGAQREQTLIQASIIEGEVNKPEYYTKVSRVIQNRLAKNMPLGMDSVVAYGNNVTPRSLTSKMLSDTANPYNARIQKGLPPTPINNPGDDTINAAMHPATGNWLYFVTVNLDTGETKFTDSEDQFKEFSKQYQDWEKNN